MFGQQPPIKIAGDILYSAPWSGANMRKRHSIVTDRFVGVVLGTTLFVLFSAFIIAGGDRLRQHKARPPLLARTAGI
jgi:hypothetical protein